MNPPLAYLDGEFRDANTARVSLFDRAYLYGDSIFETLRSYDGVPFRLAGHLDRLEHASRLTGIALTENREELTALVHETLARSGHREATIRVTVSRGEAAHGIGTAGCDAPVLSIIVRHLVGYGEQAYRRGVRSKVVGVRSVPAACLDPAMKCGNYLPNIMARRELEVDGMIEGVRLGVDGQVVGGTVSNVFLVDGDRLRTPHLASGCLPGITRAAVLEIAAGAGLKTEEDRVEPAELARADEMFFTNTIMECLPVARIDDHGFSDVPGPATAAIQQRFEELVRQETGK